MLQQITINCGEGPEAYQVILSGNNLRGLFKNAGEYSDVKGEDRVKALMAAGGVSSILRKKNGRFNDGANGEAAILTFNANGTPHAVRHFKDGRLHDGAKGEIAVQQFDHGSGTLVYAARFDNGKRVKKLTPQEIAAYVAKYPVPRAKNDCRRPV